LFLVLAACSGCSTYVFVESPWPKIEVEAKSKLTVDFDMKDLEVLGPEKQKKLMDEVVAVAVYAKTLETVVKKYNEEADRHNASFKERVLSEKETSR
jgi:hypothetical protein